MQLQSELLQALWGGVINVLIIGLILAIAWYLISNARSTFVQRFTTMPSVRVVLLIPLDFDNGKRVELLHDAYPVGGNLTVRKGAPVSDLDWELAELLQKHLFAPIGLGYRQITILAIKRVVSWLAPPVYVIAIGAISSGQGATRIISDEFWGLANQATSSLGPGWRLGRATFSYQRRHPRDERRGRLIRLT